MAIYVSQRLRTRLLAGETTWVDRNRRADYIKQCHIATPPWVKRKDIMAVYAQRKDGEEVNHIVPLKHPRVCGLNVPWNLECIPKERNQWLNNRWLDGGHPDLFGQPEQLRMDL